LLTCQFLKSLVNGHIISLNRLQVINGQAPLPFTHLTVERMVRMVLCDTWLHYLAVKLAYKNCQSITMRPRQRLLNQPTSSAHLCGNGLYQFHLKWVESVLSNIMWSLRKIKLKIIQNKKKDSWIRISISM
jgi:hypothetical protein